MHTYVDYALTIPYTLKYDHNYSSVGVIDQLQYIAIVLYTKELSNYLILTRN